MPASSFLFKPFTASMAGRRKPDNTAAPSGLVVPPRPVDMTVPPPRRLLVPSARPLLFMAAKSMSHDLFGRIQECVTSIFEEMDISRLDPTLRNVIQDQAFMAFAWLSFEDPALPPEKTAQYVRTVLARLVPRSPENFFTKGINVDARTAVCITGAIQFSRVFSGIRKFQRPDENFNLLCGKIILDDFLPLFYRDYILAPALRVFQSGIEPANEISLKHFLVPWLRVQTAVIKKLANSIWKANLSRKTSSPAVAASYIRGLREAPAPSATPFMQEFVKETDLILERVERLVQELRQYEESCLEVFDPPKQIDPMTREEYVSQVFQFKSDLKYFVSHRRMVHQYGQDDVMGSMTAVGLELGRLLREEKGLKVTQSRTAVQNITNWCLDCVQNRSFVEKFHDPDARPLLTGDMRELLAHVDFTAKLPFEMEEFGAGPRRRLFDLALWLGTRTENPGRLMSHAAETTKAVIRGSKELAAARSLYTKKEPCDSIATDLWNSIFITAVKSCGSLEIDHGELIEMLTGEGRSQLRKTIRKPLEDAICKGEPTPRPAVPKV